MKTEMSPEKIKEFFESLEKKKVHYIVIAGVGLDGKRGHLTRPHQDLDVLCSKSDLPLINKFLENLGYTGKKYNNLYKVFDNNSWKIDIELVTFEKDEAVIYESIAITRFPKSLFEHPQRGHINKVEFNIAPNELLKSWWEYSRKGNDAEYVENLPVNTQQIQKIKWILREKLEK